MIYVAKIENSIVGYVILSVKEKEGPGCISQRALLLESICVDETVRGHGIGSEIVTDVRALAKAFRCSSLILGVHPENEAALAFYQKCGFSLRTLNLQLNV
jgi:ribosomal protein S18 acetylase RimI-like enzyme